MSSNWPPLNRLALFCAILFLFGSPVYSQKRGIQRVTPKPTAEEDKTALVIGNAAYASSPLRNPVNDTKAVASTLRSLGFTVLTGENLTRRQMEESIFEFGRRIKKGGVGLFYFSGHGVQVADMNYLIPVGAAIAKEQDIRFEAVQADRILAEMEAAGNRLNIVILDACRDNPYARSFRSSTRGLAVMAAPRGTLIEYATAKGSVASDGEGSNGLFTEQLVKFMNEPGLEIGQVFRKVRLAVSDASGGAQVPWESSNLTGDFYFKLLPPAAPAGPAADPGNSGVNLDGYEVEAAVVAASRVKWHSWQSGMDSAYAKAQNLDKNQDLSPETKSRMWQDFISGYSDDNPYSNEDGAMRWYAEQRKKHWFEYDPSQPGPAAQRLSAPGLAVSTANPAGIEFIFVKGGTFQMGDVMGDNEFNDEKPIHSVTVSDFHLGKTEVTVAQYRAFCNATGRSMPQAPSWGWQDGHPIVNVSWNDAKAFCNWAGCRMPTEAEWEYAAREGGKKVRFGNGKDRADPSEINFNASTEYKKRYSVGGLFRKQTIPVWRFSPNALGLHDMSGNVWEWCSDWYGEKYYENSPTFNPQGPSSGSNRVLRGGSWDDAPWGVVCAIRGRNYPGIQINYIGFRVAR